MKDLKWTLGVANQYGVKLFLGQLSRFIYGNDAGFFNNLKSHTELRAMQKRFDAKQSDFDKRGRTLSEEGYCAVNPIYPEKLLATITAKYESLMNDDGHSIFIGPRVLEALRALINPIQDIPEISELLTPEVQKIVETHYQSYFRVLHVRAWRTFHVNGVQARQDVYSNLWHNPFQTNLLRFFVYLTDDVNEDTGALRLHPIKMTKKLMRLGYMRRRVILGPAARMIENPQLVKIISGNIGSACLINPQLCLHRAGVPKPGKHRDMVQFTLGPASKPLSATWFEELAPDPGGIRTRY